MPELESDNVLALLLIGLALGAMAAPEALWLTALMAIDDLGVEVLG